MPAPTEAVGHTVDNDKGTAGAVGGEYKSFIGDGALKRQLDPTNSRSGPNCGAGASSSRGITSMRVHCDPGKEARAVAGGAY